MGLALVGFVLVNIGLFGCFALFARGVRLRAASHERRDLEENSIIAEEWLLVRREQCSPSRCPRAVGTPPGPRRDVVCEICAAVFMERHWQRMLGAYVDPTSQPPPRSGEGEPPRSEEGSPLTALQGGHPPPPPVRAGYPRSGWRKGVKRAGSRDRAGVTVAVGPCQETRRTGPERHSRSRRLLLGAGFALALLGASLAFLSPGLFPGYFLIATGLGCLIKSGAIGST